MKITEKAFFEHLPLTRILELSTRDAGVNMSDKLLKLDEEFGEMMEEKCSKTLDWREVAIENFDTLNCLVDCMNHLKIELPEVTDVTFGPVGSEAYLMSLKGRISSGYLSTIKSGNASASASQEELETNIKEFYIRMVRHLYNVIDYSMEPMMNHGNAHNWAWNEMMQDKLDKWESKI